jgi:hypothetical protein
LEGAVAGVVETTYHLRLLHSSRLLHPRVVAGVGVVEMTYHLRLLHSSRLLHPRVVAAEMAGAAPEVEAVAYYLHHHLPPMAEAMAAEVVYYLHLPYHLAMDSAWVAVLESALAPALAPVPALGAASESVLAPA